MTLLNILRMIADLTLYGTFAGLVAMLAGGSGAMAGILLQCCCYGLSSLGKDRRWLRLLLVLPMGAIWLLYRDNLPDSIMLLPSALYVLLLVWKNEYLLQYDRQQRLFSAFWKMLLPIVLFSLISGSGSPVMAVVLSYGVTMMVTSVLLMRTLRHDRQVYCQPQYQLLNLAIMALVLAATWFFSSDFFLQSCLAVVRFFYDYLLSPIFQLIVWAVEMALWVIVELLSKLFSGMEYEMPVTDLSEILPSDKGSPAHAQPEPDAPVWLAILLLCVIIAIVVGILVLFFRWLSSQGNSGPEKEEEDEDHWIPSRLSPRRAIQKQDRSETGKIRAQYRTFLKWCGKQGIRTEAKTTSLDVHEQVRGETSAQIRTLYINARYANRADAEDVRQMKRLCAQIRQEEPIDEEKAGT